MCIRDRLGVFGGAGQPSTVTEFNSFTFNLISAASSTETGGGFQCLAGPVNDRA